MIPFPDEDDQRTTIQSRPLVPNRRQQKSVPMNPSKKVTANNTKSRRRRGSNSSRNRSDNNNHATLSPNVNKTTKNSGRKKTKRKMLAAADDLCHSTENRQLSSDHRRKSDNDSSSNYRQSNDTSTKFWEKGFVSSLISPAKSKRSSETVDKSCGNKYSSPPSITSSTTSSSRSSLPPPPKAPLRLTLRRKCKNPGKNKNKEDTVTKEVNDRYDENGFLQRTTVIRTKRPNGTTSTRRRIESISPYSPKYRKPARQ